MSIRIFLSDPFLINEFVNMAVSLDQSMPPLETFTESLLQHPLRVFS